MKLDLERSGGLFRQNGIRWAVGLSGRQPSFVAYVHLENSAMAFDL